jgi:hypothetical protein
VFHQDEHDPLMPNDLSEGNGMLAPSAMGSCLDKLDEWKLLQADEFTIFSIS